MLFTEWNWDDAKAVWHEEGVAEGLERGRSEGLEKGTQQKQIEIARNFKALGLSDKQIAAGTGLSLEEIARLDTSR